MDSHISNNHCKTSTVLYVLSGVILLLLFINIWQTYSLQSVFTEKSTPVEIPTMELAIITANSCEKCFDITTI